MFHDVIGKEASENFDSSCSLKVTRFLLLSCSDYLSAPFIPGWISFKSRIETRVIGTVFDFHFSSAT